MVRLLHSVVLLGLLLGLGSGIASAQAPVANFSSNITSGCTPIVVQFTDLSTNNPTSWSWDLGNGTQSTLKNPSTTYVVAGSYTVVLTASNASGSNTKTSIAYITANPTPTVSFTANDVTPTCAPKAVQFTNTSTANSTGTATYYWDFGDGSVSTIQNPSHNYSVPGTYSVSLVVTNGAGCNQVLNKSNYITVLPKPTANFTASNNNSCSVPLTAAFNNTSTGATTYQWDFGDGGTSTSASPTHIYTNPGSFTVRLIATNAGGCVDTLTKVAAVNIGSLVAGFNMSATSSCTRNQILFTNTTVPGAGNSTWYFGDGGTSTAANPTHAYTNPGTYTVKLVVNYNNCSDSITRIITINQGPATQFSAANTDFCTVPFTTSFTNTTVGAVGYLWDFGDGGTSTLPNPTHTYNAYGSYTVKLVTTSANGCTDTLIKTGYVRSSPYIVTYSIGMANLCAPVPVTIFANTNNSLPATFTWSFGDASTGTGSPVTHTYTAPGTYALSVTATTASGCVATVSAPLTIGTRPTAAFTASPTTVCLNQPVTFTNTSTGATSYTWLFGDGGTSTSTNPSYGYDNPGTYTPVLIASNNGCTDTFRRPNYIVVKLPKAIISPTRSCTNPYQITFANSSVGATTSFWDFGDGTTFSGTTPPPHIYSGPGIYTVTLTVTNSVTGCSNTTTYPITIFSDVTDFTGAPTTGCPGTLVSFNIPGTNVFNYLSAVFDFGDGNSAIVNSPATSINHIYTVPGNYTVTVTLSEGYGCVKTFTKTNYIQISGPTPGFTANILGGCVGSTVTFTDQSTTPNSTITNRKWDLGDGTIINTASTTVTHTYNAAGTYAVKLIVTDATGCKDSLTKLSYIIINKPTAAFTASKVADCVGKLISFSNTSTGIATLSYNWDFGDGGTSAALNPTHSYAAIGTYNVRLIVTDANGCKDTLTKPAYINISTVTAGFTTPDTLGFCPPYTVTLTNTSVSATSYQWDFGNGNTSTAANPNTVYTTAGTFTVRLRAFNANGCVDSMKKTIVVNPGPSGTLTYSPISGCLPITVIFTATSNNTTSRVWDFNNGVTQTTTGNTVTYTYTQSGFFVPKLILSNANGCSTAIIGVDTIKINKVTAGFTAAPNPVCVGAAVTFTDTSKTVSSPVTTRSWSFGDATTGTGATTTHAYTTAGTYTVRLIASAAAGCVDTTYRTIVVNPLPVITATDQAICAGDSVQLLAGGAATYSWSPATGLSCTNCANPYAKPAATTVYTITGTGANSCTATKTVTVTVNLLPTVSAGSPQTICGGTSANLLATGAATYVWTPATGLSCTSCANPVANPTVTTTYTVTGTSAAGCKNTATVMLTVIPNPTLNVTPNQTICVGDSVTLTVSGAASYVWSPATGLSSTTASTVIAKPAVTTTYTVLGNTVTNGCQTAGSVTVNVNQLPTVSAGAGRAICAGDSTQLLATGAATYVWTPATGLSCTTCANPFAKPTVPTTYTVTGTSAAGCKNTSTIAINVNPLPVVDAGASRAICEGTSTTLNATGAATYVWTPATGLSCTTCASPTANPTTTTTYTITGTSATGCKGTAQVTITVNPKPTVSAGNNVAICPGLGGTTLTATGAATYVWTPSTGLSCTTCAAPTADPGATTVYTVTGTSAAGCTNTATVSVTVNTTPVIAVAGNRTICAGDSTQLTASGANTFTWTPATGLSCTNCANPYAKPTAASTTYTVTGTSGIGCTGTTTVTITVNPLPTVSAGTPVSICEGSSTTLTATGATSYVWTPATGLSNPNIANPVANPTVTTIYTVKGTNANGCSSTATVTVTVNPKPTVSAGNNASICPGSGGTTLTATGATSYVWTPATGLSCTTCPSPVATPAGTTTYTVTGTDANGCTNTATVSVTVNTTPVIAVAGNRTICAGDSTQLTASGANTFTWTPATGLSCTNCANPYAKPTAASTTYTVTGTSGIGCTGTTTVTITVNPLPTVSAGTPVSICAGSSTTLNATGATTYVWSPATGLSCTACASPIANPTVNTIYTVVGTNANGCKNTATVTVTVNPKPTVSAGNNVSICPGLSGTTLTATGATSYVWSPATGLSCTTCASPTANPTANTTYTVTGTDANGCTNTATVAVTVNATPTVTVTGNNAFCAGDSTQLTATGANTFSWTPATGLSCTNCANPYAKPTGTTTYTVTGTSGIGCTGTTTYTVTVNLLPTLSAGPAQAICAGASANLAATGAATYVWTPAATLSNPAIANPVATPTATTTYVVTGTTAAGCSKKDSVVITVNPKPTVATAGIGICPGGSGNLLATGAATYVWTPSTGLSCTTCANPVASPAGTTTYTVTGTGANGCTATATATVTVNPLPVVNVAGTRSICFGSTTALTATGAASYVWTPATGLSCTTCANPNANPTTTTIYTVTGTSGPGCTATTTVTITVNQLPTVTTGPAQTTCAGTAVTLTAAGASTYVWTPATGLSCTNCVSPVANPTANTTYTVTGTDVNGCIGTAAVAVTVNPLPVVNAGPDTSICGLTSAQLNATGAVTYVWTPAATLSNANVSNPIATPSTTTTYTVVGTGANGCTKSDAVTVNIYAQPPVNAGPDQTICAGASATLQASGAANYVWSPAATLSCSNCTSPTALPVTNTIYQVIGTDVHGCSDSDRVAITLINRGPVSVGPGGDVCEGGSVQLSANGGSAYEWIPASGLNNASIANPVATPANTTNYQVVIKQGTCFTDTLAATVNVHPIPTVNAGPDQNVLAGTTLTLNPAVTNVATYAWSPSDGLSCIACANPVVAPLKTTTYTVNVESDFGCKASDDVTVFVTCDSKQLWLPNTFTPNADGQNDRFYPHGKGITTVKRFRIYDRWGELIYDITNMPVDDPNYGWDGIYKNQPLKPDVYVYIVNAECTTGEPVEIKGDISLLR